MISNHLGSTSTTANADGTWNSDIRYTAFGEIRLKTGVTATGYRYTGQLDMQGSIGLDYYVARFYDPQLARFTQADTMIPDPGKSVSYDRYAYVKNNPIIYNDPTGHKWVCTGANSDHCYDDGQGKKSGMATSPLEQIARKKQNQNYWQGTSPLPNVANSLNFSAPATNQIIIQPNNPIIKPYDPKTSYTEWEVNPSEPDYYSFTLSYLAGNGNLIIDRYRNVYIGGGGNLGKGLPVGFSIAKGQLFIGSIATERTLQRYLDGLAGNGIASIFVGKGVNLPLLGDNITSNEIVIFSTPQLGISVVFTPLIFDNDSYGY